MAANSEEAKRGMAIQEAIWKRGGTDFHALMACKELVCFGKQVDPDAFGNGISILLILESLDIQGERMGKLWWVCGCDAGKMIAALRAYELGQLAGVNQQTLNHAIENRGAGIDLNAVVTAVKSRLPNFNPTAKGMRAVKVA